jgi:hypothetical protein
MKTLKEISGFLNYPSDKDTYHNYLPVYENEFNKLDNVKILELGVYTGGSLKLWTEYFNNAEVHGIEHTNYSPETKINAIMHWGKYEALYQEFEDNYFDYIINDSMHDANSQIDAFNLYYPKLKYGGKFFMEDIINENQLKIILGYLDGYSLKVWNMNDTSKSKDSIILAVYK